MDEHGACRLLLTLDWSPVTHKSVSYSSPTHGTSRHFSPLDANDANPLSAERQGCTRLSDAKVYHITTWSKLKETTSRFPDLFRRKDYGGWSLCDALLIDASDMPLADAIDENSNICITLYRYPHCTPPHCRQHFISFIPFHFKASSFHGFPF